MRKISGNKNWVFIIVWLSVFPVFGQDSEIVNEKSTGFLFGLSAGINISARAYDYQVNPTPPFGSFRFAPSGGLVLGYQFGKSFGLQTLWKYQGKGDKINVANWLNEFESPQTVTAVWGIEPSGSITTRLHYAEVSLLPVFGLGSFRKSVQFQFGFGGFAAFGLGGSEIQDYRFTYFLDYEFDSEDVIQQSRQVEFVTLIPDTYGDEYVYFNSVDYGVLLYGGLRYNNVNLGAYFTFGMKELEYASLNFGFWSQPKDLTKTRTLTLALTYFL
jgi:hypothetical protein